MRRTIAAFAALLMTSGLVLVGAAPARADTVPFDPIAVTSFARGSLDSLVVVPGQGIVATGWMYDTQNPGAALMPDSGSWQVLRPDGSATWYGSHDNRAGLSRPDVAAAYPEAGPNHGFQATLGYPGQAGTYRFCARWRAEVVGCRSVQVDAEMLSGAAESLTAELSPDSTAIRVRGWVADTWVPQDNWLSFNLDHTDADPSYNYSKVIPGSSSLARPDIQASRPGLAGVRGFEQTFPIDRPGSYKVCVWAQPYYNYPGNLPAGLGCVSTTVTGMKELTPAALSGVPVPGSTLTYTPATWTPSPTNTRILWESSGRPATREGALDYPITLADVGHTITTYQMVSAPGVLRASTGRISPTVTLPGVAASRVDGQDRYAVAVANSRAQFPDAATGAPVVYVAAGKTFADALSAGPAAAAEGGALLLTPSDRLPAPVKAEISRLHPASIVVVGGAVSVSDAVLRELRTLAPATRLGGPDRYAVSRAVVAHAFPAGSSNAFVVTGTTYPDALSAGAAAGSTGAPVLLTRGLATSADPGTRDALSDLGATAVTIVGGEASVSAGVAASLGAGIAVTRLSGPDRYSAAIALNRGSFTQADTVFLATGKNFSDGLAVGARAGLQHAPLYLVNGQCVPLDVVTDIVALGASKVVVVGGTSSVARAVESLYVCP
ncbi:cell wall-binding repeat-containing protein [Herbiconiux sp. CPCC 203407]|uniref:Cell wall-binding repeat-containing protein n=1 Tax=Herbiconiux oxytropis TaxID=2970915 RepID=A0AA41XGY1_9MICO|nr:cell wall-binding repeat-containing protein [Herbiconiux oxytropis]MCS5721767.1 cell wall-binding repeat-containing protein [Herbiconiux oxytropis]MCS5727992.1 cell wall-binding repeat-containing protein [Herbiconiux oxytropis]